MLHTAETGQRISDIVQSQQAASHRHGLRSADSNDYIKPGLNIQFSKQSFSYAGPLAWSLSVHSTHNINSFK